MLNGTFSLFVSFSFINSYSSALRHSHVQKIAYDTKNLRIEKNIWRLARRSCSKSHQWFRCGMTFFLILSQLLFFHSWNSVLNVGVGRSFFKIERAEFVWRYDHFVEIWISTLSWSVFWRDNVSLLVLSVFSSPPPFFSAFQWIFLRFCYLLPPRDKELILLYSKEYDTYGCGNIHNDPFFPSFSPPLIVRSHTQWNHIHVANYFLSFLTCCKEATNKSKKKLIEVCIESYVVGLLKSYLLLLSFSNLSCRNHSKIRVFPVSYPVLTTLGFFLIKKKHQKDRWLLHSASIILLREWAILALIDLLLALVFFWFRFGTQHVSRVVVHANVYLISNRNYSPCLFCSFAYIFSLSSVFIQFHRASTYLLRIQIDFVEWATGGILIPFLSSCGVIFSLDFMWSFFLFAWLRVVKRPFWFVWGVYSV